MDKKDILDLYTDYLISSFSFTTATGLSNLLDNVVSHDQITRFLSNGEYTSKDLWKKVKPIVRQVESLEGVVIIDDTIEEKPYTDENDIIAWHYDHSKSRNVKGINILTAMYYLDGVSLPVAIDIVKKTETVMDKKTGKPCRKSPISKNEKYREMLQTCVDNNILFGYVLNDIWYSSAENMRFIKLDLKKEFVMPLKTNRKVATSIEDKENGRYTAVESLELEEGIVWKVYLEQVSFPLYLAKQVFINDDGSTGTLYLITSDETLAYDKITTIYRKRWKVEEYHKSIKNNASLAKSPTKTVKTQTNHLFASVFAYLKLELLKIQTNTNHFSLKAKLYIKALKASFQELQAIHYSTKGVSILC